MSKRRKVFLWITNTRSFMHVEYAVEATVKLVVSENAKNEIVDAGN